MFDNNILMTEEKESKAKINNKSQIVMVNS